MRMLQLAYANLKEHFLSTILSVMLLGIGVGMVSFIVTVSEQLNDRFNRDIRGIDMVVGAKGSPLQIILASIFHSLWPSRPLLTLSNPFRFFISRLQLGTCLRTCCHHP